MKYILNTLFILGPLLASSQNLWISELKQKEFQYDN